MELITFSSLSVFFILIFLLYKILFKRNSGTIMKLPPGPKRLPIIGNLHQYSYGLTHYWLRDMADKYGPLMYLKLGQISTIVISSPEMAKEIYKTHDLLFSDRPTSAIDFKILSYNFSDVIFSPYGIYWKTLRKICVVELLNSKSVQSFRSIREEEVIKLIKSIISSSSSSSHVINLTHKIYALTHVITSRVAFGKQNKSTEKFEKLTAEISKFANVFGITDLFPCLKFLEMFSKAKRQMDIIQKQVDEILEDVLNEHKRKREKLSSKSLEDYNIGDENEDIVDVLLRIQRDGDYEVPISDTHIKGVIFDIFIAGSETSSTIVEWAISEILRSPRILKRAREEIRNRYDDRGNVDESNLEDLKYLQAIVKETLRVHPSAPLLGIRQSREQCKINGYDIPPNSIVIVNGWVLARDPNFWTDEPEVFKPERFLDSKIDFRGNHLQYMPFGGGRRICPGINFAHANILLPLAQLLFHFEWKLSGDRKLEDLDVEEIEGINVRRKNDLMLIPIPYNRSSLIMAKK